MSSPPAIPGELLLASEPVVLGPQIGQELVVRNVGDRPIQVGSHFHLAAANPALEMDRDAATGMRLAVPAGTLVRFEPGIERVVRVVPLGGTGTVPGLRLDVPDSGPAPHSGTVSGGTWAIELSRYAKLYGPTHFVAPASAAGGLADRLAVPAAAGGGARHPGVAQGRYAAQ